MITKNLIVDQLPECNNLGTKSIRGLISLNIGAKTLGCVRVFNVSDNFLPLLIALKIGEQKFVFRDVTTPQNYEFSLPSVDPDSPITVLLASKMRDKISSLAVATSPNSKEKYEELFAELNDKELNTVIDEEMAKFEPEHNSADLCKVATQTSEEDDLKNTDSNSQQHEQVESTGNFYALIQPQLDELFSKFPHFLELEDLVANTEWVKVNFAPDEDQHYILGKLYEGEKVTHICYGIPANSHSISPPESIADYCQWLPLDLNNVDSAGYWVMYQDAGSGANVRVN